VLGLILTVFLSTWLIFGVHIAAVWGAWSPRSSLNAMAFGTIGAAIASTRDRRASRRIFRRVRDPSCRAPSSRRTAVGAAKTIAEWNLMSLIADGLREPIVTS
jgi:hypothetical protein